MTDHHPGVVTDEMIKTIAASAVVYSSDGFNHMANVCTNAVNILDSLRRAQLSGAVAVGFDDAPPLVPPRSLRGYAEAIMRALWAGDRAQLPEGYRWGEDAMGSFEVGKRQAMAAVREALDMPPPPPSKLGQFYVGRLVVKLNGYAFPSEIRAVFTNKAGAPRVVAEDDRGILHVFSEKQMSPAPPLAILTSMVSHHVQPGNWIKINGKRGRMIYTDGRQTSVEWTPTFGEKLSEGWKEFREWLGQPFP